MRKTNVMILAVLLIFTSAVLYGEVISEIRIQGDLQKTRESTVLKIVDIEEGDKISAANIEEIRQRLLRSGLFIDDEVQVSLENEDSRTILVLELKDRFSLIPLPFVSISEDDFSAGGFLIDNNLLGTGNTVFLGGLYGRDVTYVSASYMENGVRNSPLNIGAGVMYVNASEEAEDTDGNMTFTRDGWTLGGNIFGQLELNPFLFGLSLRSGLRSIEDVVSETVYISPVVGVGYDGQELHEYFRDGLMADVEYAQTFYTREFAPTGEFHGNLQYDFIPHPRLLFSSSANVMLFTGTTLLSPEISSPLLSSAVHADKQVQASVKMAPVIADFSWGFLALPLGYQAGVLEGDGLHHELYHGPWGGLMLYLKKVAIPALSIRYGYNMETGTGEYSFSMGFQS